MSIPVSSMIGIEEYHRREEVGKSDLDLIARSPAHYRQAKAAPVEPTSAMIFGSAFHVKVLQPDEFEKQVSVAPFDSRRTKAYTEWAAGQNGKTIIMPDDYEAICAMHDAILAHPLAAPLLTGGVGETSYFWIDSRSGVACKCRPDYLRPDGLVVDLKTTDDASPDNFARSCAKYRYHVQHAHYIDGLRCVGGGDFRFLFLAIEKSPPYAIGLYLPDAMFHVTGETLRDKNLATFARCQQTGEWPAYPAEFLPLSLPAWALKESYDE